MMRLAVPTKVEVDGVGETGGGGGNGVPTATGALGGIATDGTLGVVRNRIAIETSATITRNTTHSRIRSFAAFMDHSRHNYRSRKEFHAKTPRKTQRRKESLCVLLCAFA